MSDGLHVLRAEYLRAALSPSVLQSIPSEVLAGFISQRRWFGAKTGAVTEVRFTDIVSLPWGKNGSVVACMRVTADGQQLQYQLPLTVTEEGTNQATTTTAIASVEAGDARGVLIDATEDSDFRRSLGEAFEQGASFQGESSEWKFERVGDESLGIAGLEPMLGSAEQSNTSMVFGDRAILKLFRRLESGENPDPEIGSALTEAGFEHVPALMGRVRFVTRDGTIDAGMLQQLVPGSTDAWKYALEAGKSYFRSKEGTEPANTFLPDAEVIGRVTRSLHEALGSIQGKPAFTTQPASARNVAEWGKKAKRSVTEGLDLLSGLIGRKGLPKDRVPEAEVLLRRRDHFVNHLDEIVRATEHDGGARIRHHGDYHLGQLLHGADGQFYVIDFEGEPARPLAERRETHSALRDVAGMLRSFGYAAATLATEAGSAIQPHVRELLSARWERDARNAFLRGYLATEVGAGAFLPKGDDSVRQLISLFETEKVFYELAYELNNRPDWVWIPMRGISKLLVSSAQSPSSGASRSRGRSSG